MAPEEAPHHGTSAADAPAGPPWRLRRRLFLPLAAAVTVLSASSVVGVRLCQREAVQRAIATDARTVRELINGEVARESQTLLTLARSICLDEQLADAFRARDRDRLLARARPLYDQLHRSCAVTHLHFAGLDRVNYLRVHRPHENGDRIDRITTTEAARTGRPAWGSELGPLGSFTLRVVVPWRDDQGNLGYVELGREYRDVIAPVQLATRTDFCLSFNKEFLDQERWHSSMMALGRDAEWNELPSVVITAHTSHKVDRRALVRLQQEQGSEDQNTATISASGRELRASFSPLEDAQGRGVGQLMIVHDLTERLATTGYVTAVVSAICLVLGAVILGLLFVLLGRVDRTSASQATRLQEYRSEHQAAVSRHNHAERTLQSAHAKLEERFAEQTAELRQTRQDLAEANAELARSQRPVQ